MTATQQYIVSTDLDGTLLDHHNYQWQAAADALDILKNNRVPIIFNTSKTLAEALALQNIIGIEGPLIVENGSALAIPKQDHELIQAAAKKNTRAEENHLIVEFGQNRNSILDFIASKRAQYGEILSGYNDWNIDEIILKTGLQKADAQLSSQKLFSEPFIWQADDETLAKFSHDARAEGFKITKGGRFFHIQGDTDKAQPIIWLKNTLETANKNTEYSLICLGDNDNDIAMLNAADIPVCVRSPIASYPAIAHNPRTIHTDAMGPEGWQEAMSIIFSASGLR